MLDLGNSWEYALQGRPFSGASPRHSVQGSAPGSESHQETGQPASPLQRADAKKKKKVARQYSRVIAVSG